jgi:hypothetical protein
MAVWLKIDVRQSSGFPQQRLLTLCGVECVVWNEWKNCQVARGTNDWMPRGNQHDIVTFVILGCQCKWMDGITDWHHCCPPIHAFCSPFIYHKKAASFLRY